MWNQASCYGIWAAEVFLFVFIKVKFPTLKQATYTFNLRSSQCWMGFPGGSSGKEPACRCKTRKRRGLDPWVGKVPWRRAWQPPPVFLPGEFPWIEEPGRLQSMGLQRVGHDWATKHTTHTHIYHTPLRIWYKLILPEKGHTQIMYKIFPYNFSRVPGLLKGCLWTDWEFIDYRIRTHGSYLL